MRIALFSMIVSLSGLGVASADVISIAPNGDTSIYSESGDNAGGGDPGIFLGITNQDNERRALLRFDIAAAMPTGSTITAVTLRLVVDQSQGNDFTSELHALSGDWTEGSTVGAGASGGGGPGGPAVIGDVTWTRRVYDTISWTTPGGDYSATTSASSSVPGSGDTAVFTSAGMVSDAQAWLDTPAANFGWILVPIDAGTKQARRFASKESPIDPPELLVTFTPPAASGACCAADSTCTVVADPGSTCAGSYQGLDVACSQDLCTPPTGACCLPNVLGTCQMEEQSACEGLGGSYRGDNQLCAMQECPIVLEPFVDALPIPRAAVPTTGTAGAEASYKLSVVQLTQRLHRDLPMTKVWGYDDGAGGSYPGPTIEAGSGAPIDVEWANDLRDSAGALLDTHALAVDTCPHGVNDDIPRTVVHLHGGHVPAAVDGYPEFTQAPGESVNYPYPNNQGAATLWYHDHALGITRLNVYMGLAGFYIIRDAAEDALALPSGNYDVPLVVQDRTFNADGSLRYPVAWEGHVVHDTVLVNGKVWPFMNVDKGMYRFRILNGSGTRTYRFKFSDDRSFQLIGSDGGLLAAPVTVSSVTVAAGERVEVVVDFRNDLAGAEVLLQNDAPAPFPGTAGQGVVPDVMKFIVGSNSGALGPVPSTLRSILPLAPDQAAEARDFVLKAAPDTCSGGNKWLINGLGWDDIVERPELGTSEVWRFVNDSGAMHPMHMHLVFFQVLERQAFEMVDGVVTPVGPILPLHLSDGGWKDTVQVPPGEMVRVISRFEDYTGLFAYHCHILEHEDHEMMRQFETFSNCGDGVLGQPDEECDDEGESAQCNADCTIASCGDGVLNASAGETCDDGNQAADDGCEPTCLLPEPIEEKKEDGGCGCRSTSGGTNASLLFMALALLGLRRRRRKR